MVYRQDKTEIRIKCEAVAIRDKTKLVQYIEEGWEFVFMTPEDVYLRIRQVAPRKDDQADSSVA